MALQDDAHVEDCGCQPCLVKRACLRKLMQALALEGHNKLTQSAWNIQ